MEDLSFEGDYGQNDSFRSDSDSFPAVSTHLLSSQFLSPTTFTSLPAPRLQICTLSPILIPSDPSQTRLLQSQLRAKDEEIESLRVMQRPSEEAAVQIQEMYREKRLCEAQIAGLKGQIEGLMRTVESLRAGKEEMREERLKRENEALREEMSRRDKEIAAYRSSETRIMSLDEMKRMRQSLDEKTKKLHSLERLLPANTLHPTNLFTFLSSPEAKPWTEICGLVAEMLEAAEGKRDQEMVEKLDRMVEVLEEEDMRDSLATERLADASVRLTKSLSSLRVPWDQVKETLIKARDLCTEEVQRLGRPSSPVAPKLQDEDYLSDFSDEDFSVEISEEDCAGKAVKLVQAAVKKLQFSHSGSISPLELFDLLRLRVVDADEAGIEAFIRRLPMTNGAIQFEQLVQNLQHRPLQWWLKTLASASFDIQHMVKNGAFVHVPTWDEWVGKRVVAKVARFLVQEKRTAGDFVRDLFDAERLTKRELRKKLRQMNVPLNREDCHALFRLIDSGEGFTTSLALQSLLEVDESDQTPAEKPPPTDEYFGLSEKDARFRLIQAEKHIAELEKQRPGFSPHLAKEHTLTLEVTTLKKDCEILCAQLEESRRELRALQSENEALHVRLALPRDSDLRTLEAALGDQTALHVEQLQTVAAEKDRLLTEWKRKSEEDKAGLIRLVKSKNRELEALGAQVDNLLRDLRDLRAQT